MTREEFIQKWRKSCKNPGKEICCCYECIRLDRLWDGERKELIAKLQMHAETIKSSPQRDVIDTAIAILKEHMA